MDHEKVAEHYNTRKLETRDSRRQSPIFQLRQFNNWLKYVLIDLHTRPGNSVLDLCCGKGGDLHKWMQACVSTYVGCDIARLSVSEAAKRFNNLDKPSPFRPILRVGDCFDVSISKHIPESILFDIVSCQFSMHYAFENVKRVRQFLQNVTDRLKPGGFFIGTTVDANVVVRKIRAVNELQISNAIYQIRFDKVHAKKRFPVNNPYGIRYSFTLDQSVEECPEFLVHFPTFEKLAAEYDLKLVMHSNFHDFFTEFSDENSYANYHRLLFSMRAVDQHGTISPDEWDAIYLYTAFAFRKNSASTQPAPVVQDASSVPVKQWPSIEPEEILDMDS